MTNLVRLVDDLLDVARITRGKIELRRSEVDLAAVVQHALAAVRPLCETRGHELSVILSSGAFRMHADAGAVTGPVLEEAGQDDGWLVSSSSVGS